MSSLPISWSRNSAEILGPFAATANAASRFQICEPLANGRTMTLTGRP
jgi:hypothetical protein